MICPKCDLGILQKIRFKKDDTPAILCEYCGALWLKDEEITAHTGHELRLYTHEQDREYTFDTSEQERENEHRYAQ